MDSTAIFRLEPEGFARARCPIVTKIAVVGREPRAMEEGLAVDFYKGKGDQSKGKTQRSILLGNTTSMVHHKFARSKVWSVIALCMHDTRFGGFKGRNTDVPTHYVRSRFLSQKNQKISSIALYIDLTAACYSIVEPYVLALPGE
eukprot:1111828-Pyramimonas_sp.AAC.1